MHNPTIHILVNEARTEDLHRAAQKFRQERPTALTSRETRQRRRPRPASIRRAIQHLNGLVPGDADAPPFADGSFRLSHFGIRRADRAAPPAPADELVRVCQAGGTIGLVNWTPEGSLAALRKAPTASEARARQLLRNDLSGLPRRQRHCPFVAAAAVRAGLESL